MRDEGEGKSYKDKRLFIQPELMIKNSNSCNANVRQQLSVITLIIYGTWHTYNTPIGFWNVREYV